MKGKRKGIGLFIFIICAFAFLGVGYAAIANINLTVNGKAGAHANGDFKVEFTGTPVIADNVSNKIKNYSNSDTTDDLVDGETQATINATTKTLASFEVYGFENKDEYATVTYTVTNQSADLSAKLSVTSDTVTNTEYFNIDTTIADTDTNGATLAISDGKKVLPAGKSVEVTVKVTLIKTPVTANQLDNNISTALTAEPVNP